MLHYPKGNCITESPGQHHKIPEDIHSCLSPGSPMSSGVAGGAW